MSFFERSDTKRPESLFTDLHNEDLVLAACCEGRCQLAWLEVSPYQRGLLERGLNCRAWGEYLDRQMEQGMGYTATMGTMLMDEVVGHCEREEARFMGLRTNLGKVEEELGCAQEWLIECGAEIKTLKRQNCQLLVSWTAMRDDLDRMWREMDGLLQLNAWMVGTIVQMRTSLVHNWDNPIVIDDDSSDEMAAEAPDVLEQFCLVPIEDMEEVVEDSEGESSGDEVWEITREEFEDAVVDVQGESPEL